MTLSPRRAKFAAEYAKDGNGTRAAKAAGFAERAAHVTASRLLRDAKVVSEIDRLQRKDAAKVNLTREKIIAGLQEWASSDNPSAAVKAWELLGKHLGMFEDRLVISNGLRDVIAALRAELAEHPELYDRVLSRLERVDAARGLLPERAE